MASLAERVAARYKGKKEVPKADGKGTTTVYEYSKAQIDHRNREKAKRLEKLRSRIGKLRSQVQKDLAAEDSKLSLTALAIGLMDETFERVGNPESASEGHFGVTGWKKNHVSFSGGKATVSYVGKSGVKQKKTVSNKALVKALRKAYDDCKDGGCITGEVQANDVNAYLKKFDISAKDIRGFHANDVMKANLKAQRKGSLPEDKKEREAKLKKEFQKALEETAKAVGHEPSTLKSQYLVPGLADSYLKDGTVPEKMVKEGSLPERVAARWFEARAIRIDKGRIKELAKELEVVISRKARGPRPLGNRVLVPAAPYDVRAVDGSTINVYIRLNAIETDSGYYVVDGGYGFHTRYQAPIVIVNVNGSMVAEELGAAAKAHQIQRQLFPVLLHELTHAADKYTSGVGAEMTRDKARGNEDYYNHPSEVRAYMQEVVDEVQSRAKFWPKFQKMFGPSKGVMNLLKFSPTWGEVSPYWTEKNQRLVIKAVVQALNDLEGESRVAAKYAAEITKREVDQWKKDLRRMTKIYRSIENVDSWNDPEGYAKAQELGQEAWTLFRAFRENLKTWGFRVVLPQLKDQSYLEQTVRDALSDAVYRLDSTFLFPTLSDRKTLDLSQLTRKRKSHIKAYQRAFVEFFKALESYIESRGGTLERRAPKETYQVAGMTVVVDTYTLTEESKYQETLDEFLHALQRAGVQPIQRAGLGVALKGLTLHVVFNRSDMVAGQYDPGKDELTVFPLGLVTGARGHGTFVHEVGHRFYFRNLSSNARKHWEESMEGRVVKMEADDIRSFVRQHLRGKRWVPTRQELEDEVLQAKHDPELEAKHLQLANGLPGFTSDVDEIEQYLLKNRVGDRVQLEAITEYGRTNPTEAFAEAFRLWVLQGPSVLGEWTREFFKTILRSGGAKVAGYALQGLTREEFAQLKQQMKSAFNFRFTLKYWTSPKRAIGQVTIRAPKANDWEFEVEEVEEILRFLIRNGYESSQVTLREQLSNPILWTRGGISFYKKVS